MQRSIFVMRRFQAVVLSWVIVTSFTVFQKPALRAENDGPTLVVDDDRVQCPTAGFTKIQDAVNAAPAGATIRVCPGTYPEQVSISKTLTLRGDNGAVLLPSNMAANTTSLVTSAPIAAVVLVADTERVTLDNLTVDAANNGITGCGPDLMGIYFRNASGKITNVAVRNTKLPTSLNGCQSGLGIFVQSANGTMSRVEVDGSSVHDFQKNGITGNETGTEITISRNAIAGLGPTDGAAQNGIQVGFGARGTIESNSVSNLVWSPCISVATCTATATGVLIFNSDDVTVQNNVVGDTQGGIYVQGGHGEIQNNTIFNTLVFDGIALVGDGNEAQRNFIANSSESGIFIQGNDNVATGNRINEAPIGVLKVSGSVGNTIVGNHFFNTPIPIQDPAAVGPAQSKQVYR
jgi:parallel beta-helix repeat protein